MKMNIADIESMVNERFANRAKINELEFKRKKEIERIEGWQQWLINEISDVEKILKFDFDYICYGHTMKRGYYKRYKSDMEKELKIIEINSKIE